MISDEHGKPDRATGAQGAEDLTDGVSPNGSSQGGYSALAGWAADDSVPPSDATPASFNTGTGRAAHGFSAVSSDHQAGQGTAPGFSAEVPASPTGATGDEQPPDDAGPAADTEDAQSGASRKRRMSGWRELPILIVVALTIALVIKTFVVQPFYIPSSSMENTLMIGDKVLVNKLVYHFRSIEPGDIIVFNGDGSWNPNPPAVKPASNPFVRAYDVTLGPLFHSIAGLLGTPLDQVDYIKRVIGVPGDRVKCCNAQGLVTVNGVPLHEQSYIFPDAAPSQIKFNIVVPPGRLWVMGDNRAVSDDSRLRSTDPDDGTIPESKVIGRAFVIIWPPSHWRILPIPSTFHQPGIGKPASAAADKASAAAAQVIGAPVRPEGPYLPLAVGAVGAVPLTWLQRRARRGIAERLRRRRQHRHS